MRDRAKWIDRGGKNLLALPKSRTDLVARFYEWQRAARNSRTLYIYSRSQDMHYLYLELYLLPAEERALIRHLTDADDAQKKAIYDSKNALFHTKIE